MRHINILYGVFRPVIGAPSSITIVLKRFETTVVKTGRPWSPTCLPKVDAPATAEAWELAALTGHHWTCGAQLNEDLSGGLGKCELNSAVQWKESWVIMKTNSFLMIYECVVFDFNVL